MPASSSLSVTKHGIVSARGDAVASAAIDVLQSTVPGSASSVAVNVDIKQVQASVWGLFCKFCKQKMFLPIPTVNFSMYLIASPD